MDLTRADVGIDLPPLSGVVDTTVRMSGPMTVHRAAAAGNPAVIQTEILSMTLTGGTPTMTLRAGKQNLDIDPLIRVAMGQTTGEIKEQAGDNQKADSYFNVFFELDLGGGQKLYNHVALRVDALIWCAPPSANFERLPGGSPILLYTNPDPNGGGTPQDRSIITVKHNTDPDPNPSGFCTLYVDGKGKVCLTDISEAACAGMGGVWNATTCIPTVTEWGLVVMAMLVLTAATVVIMRRRAMVRGGS